MTLCSFASFSNGDPIKSSRRLKNIVHYILRSTLRDRTYWDRVLPTFGMHRSRERIHHREQMILVVTVRQAQRTRNEKVEPASRNGSSRVGLQEAGAGVMRGDVRPDPVVANVAGLAPLAQAGALVPLLRGSQALMADATRQAPQA
jgi:hypothetical protein